MKETPYKLCQSRKCRRFRQGPTGLTEDNTRAGINFSSNKDGSSVVW